MGRRRGAVELGGGAFSKCGFCEAPVAMGSLAPHGHLILVHSLPLCPEFDAKVSDSIQAWVRSLGAPERVPIP